MSADTTSPSSSTGLPAPIKSALFQRLRSSLVTSETGSVDTISAAPSKQFPEPSALAQSLPLAVQAAIPDPLNPLAPSGASAKEIPNLQVSVESPAVDVVPGMQYVETEKTHEMPPEVDGFLKKLENHHDQLPNEVVITNLITGQSTPHYLAQPVIVLPITKEVEEVGVKKPLQFSIRWLVEWSRKIMKTFSGRIVYREVGV